MTNPRSYIMQNLDMMLWALWHYWPSGAMFVFNCYKQWGTLVARNGQGTAYFVRSRERVTQGDPLLMVTYELNIPTFHHVH